MLPDTGERYMSTPLFGDIGEDMNEAEIALSRSTPGYRFDAPSCALPPAPVQAEPDADTAEFVERLVNETPVVMFALEWCEFSWSVRKLFTRLGISYESVDLDAVAYQRNDRGAKIRAALNDKLGTPTIPQVFIGGRHMGGCSELFDAMRNGSMQRQLDAAGVDYDKQDDFDPDELLPQWAHPRKIA
jgi:cysteine synthase A